MNPLPPNADDLVSAYLDAEASPDEIVTVESSPELMARVESLRALTSQLSTPAAPPAAQKEAHLAAALGAFDELFGGQTTSEPAVATPTVAAVPMPSAAPDPVVQDSVTHPPGTTSTVSSFEAAQSRRQARKPRRFNAGIIAAAAAALLLMVALALVGIGGRGGDDAATSASDGVQAGSAESVDTAGDSTDDAIDDGDSAGSASGVSEPDQDQRAGAPAPDSPAIEAAEAAPESDDSMSDDSMSDDSMAMDDEAMEEAASDEGDAIDEPAEAQSAPAEDNAFTGADLYRTNYFLGEFDTIADLQAELDMLTSDDVALRLDQGQQLLFPRCQEAVLELSQSQGPTLIAAASLEGTDVEVHRLLGARNDQTTYIVTADGCELIDTLP